VSHVWIDEQCGGKSRLLTYTPTVIEVSALQLMLAVLTGWLDRREREVLRYLLEENGADG
jgi:hypothetical protein